jgi:hypothetical protein
MNFCPTCPRIVVARLLGIAFGLAVALVGLSHYLQFQGFSASVVAGLGPLSDLGTIWAYLLPGLFIVGGALLVAGTNLHIAAWALGIGLGSIVVGMPLKSVVGGVELSSVISTMHSTFIWLIVYALAIKMAVCEKK